MANKGHYQTAGQTRQGIYVCSASGKLMSSINSLNADAVLNELKDKRLPTYGTAAERKERLKK